MQEISLTASPVSAPHDLSRISPITLYADIATIMLKPIERLRGFVLPVQLDRAIKALLPFGQSVLVIWPQPDLRVLEELGGLTSYPTRTPARQSSLYEVCVGGMSL